ncbi:MAG: hypothetical protein F7B60_05885 [Desulfurococcales archaeon]|nr:hypothetical protein [Desulfurococcales archaeon]
MRYDRIADIYLVIGFILLPLAYLLKESSAGGVIGVTSLLFLGIGLLFHLAALTRFKTIRRVADIYLVSSFVLFVVSYFLKGSEIGLVSGLFASAVFQVSILFYIVAFVYWFNSRRTGEVTVS